MEMALSRTGMRLSLARNVNTKPLHCDNPAISYRARMRLRDQVRQHAKVAQACVVAQHLGHAFIACLRDGHSIGRANDCRAQVLQVDIDGGLVPLATRPRGFDARSSRALPAAVNNMTVPCHIQRYKWVRPQFLESSWHDECIASAGRVEEA